MAIERERPGIGRAMAAGLLATTVVTALIYLAPLLGLPKMDLFASLGSTLSGSPTPSGSFLWWVGLLWHFNFGTIIFPHVYLIFVYPVLPGTPTIRGTLWGAILFLIAEMGAIPIMGGGFFSSHFPDPILAVIGCLIAHLFYGALFGALAGEGKIMPMEARQPKAA